MDEDLKLMISNRKLASYRVLGWIGVYTKGKLCNILGLSRPTLDRRLKLHNWKYSEIETINNKMPF